MKFKICVYLGLVCFDLARHPCGSIVLRFDLIGVHRPQCFLMLSSILSACICVYLRLEMFEPIGRFYAAGGRRFPFASSAFARAPNRARARSIAGVHAQPQFNRMQLR